MKTELVINLKVNDVFEHNGTQHKVLENSGTNTVTWRDEMGKEFTEIVTRLKVQSYGTFNYLDLNPELKVQVK